MMAKAYLSNIRRSSFAFGALIVLLLVAAAILGARARAEELLAGAGPQLLALAGHPDGPVQELRVNGARLHLLNAASGQALGPLLDAFEARCKAGRGPDESGAFSIDAILRHGDGQRGYLACLLPKTRGRAVRDWVERAGNFLAVGDLSALGDLRFVWATATPHGTHYVALWSEGALPLSTMFPSQSDAPGRDLVGVPRPPDARRILSGAPAGAAPTLAGYLAPEPLPRVRRRYRAALRDHGFAVDAITEGRPAERATQLMFATKGARRLLIALAPAQHGSGTLATLTRL